MAQDYQYFERIQDAKRNLQSNDLLTILIGTTSLIPQAFYLDRSQPA